MRSGVFSCVGINCTLNMVHSECGSPCTDTCSNQEGTQLCADHCVDGCVCPSGKTMLMNSNSLSLSLCLST